MIARYRWYKIQVPPSKSDPVGELSRFTLTEDKEYGFLPNVFQSPYHYFKFYWRSRLAVPTIDHHGDTIFEEVRTISTWNFALINRDASWFLRLENPPRSIRDLMNSLESVFGFGFRCQPLTYDLGSVAHVFHDFDSFRLTGLCTTDVVVKKDVLARMEFVSKLGLDIRELSPLDGLRYTIDSLSFLANYKGINGHVSFGKSGTLKVSGRLSERVVHLVEERLVFAPADK